MSAKSIISVSTRGKKATIRAGISCGACVKPVRNVSEVGDRRQIDTAFKVVYAPEPSV